MDGTGDQLNDFFEVDEAAPRPGPRYNIAPTQKILVLRPSETGARSWRQHHWGLIPAWSQDSSRSARMINARSETVEQKPSFRDAFGARRCIIPASGYYEWVTNGSRKQPHYIAPTDVPYLAFAGLWERWVSHNGEVIESCTIMTRPAEQSLIAIHHRMPVLLHQHSFSAWLSTPVEASAPAKKILLNQPGALLRVHPVSTRVNTVRNDDVDCIRPIEKKADGDPQRDPGEGNGQLDLI